jgi:hypothetical protein
MLHNTAHSKLVTEQVNLIPNSELVVTGLKIIDQYIERTLKWTSAEVIKAS